MSTLFRQTTTQAPPELLFAADQKSSTPRLKFATPYPMSESELAPWQSELEKAYERLVSGVQPREFEFTTELGRLPRRYLVKVQPTRSRGVSTLVLTPITPPRGNNPGAAEAKTNGRASPSKGTATTAEESRGVEWSATAFVESLSLLLENVELEPRRREAVDQMLAEMHRLSNENPTELLLLLFAGFLRIRSHRGSFSQHDLAAVCASHALDEVCAALLFDEEAAPAPTNGAIGELIERNVKKLMDFVTHPKK